jgi:plasmid stability protein
MTDLSKRATIYLEPEVYRALGMKAAARHSSLSALVNQILKQIISEDEEDLAAFEERKGERLLTMADLAADLKKHGKI